MSVLRSLIPARVWAYIVGAALALMAAVGYVKHSENAAVERELAKQNQINQEKHDAATKADSDARLCAADPTCRMRPDQYLRR